MSSILSSSTKKRKLEETETKLEIEFNSNESEANENNSTIDTIDNSKGKMRATRQSTSTIIDESKKILIIKIVDEQVAKNKLYLPFPTSLQVTTPSNSENFLYSFSKIKEFYPIGLFDHNGILVHLPRVVLHFHAEYEGEDENCKILNNSFDTILNQMKGIYWFKALKAHIVGVIHISITPVVEDESIQIEPLLFDIEVKDGERSRGQRRNVIFQSSIVEEGKEPMLSKTNPQNITSSSSKKSSTVKSEVIPNKDVLISEKISTLTSKTIPEQEIDDFKFKTLPFPKFNILSSKYRLDAKYDNLQPLTLNGPQMTIQLKLPLTRVLYDDRLRIQELKIMYPQLVDIGNQYPSIQLKYVTTNETSPSVSQLLFRLENRLKSSSITDYEEVIQSLQLLFEYYFMDKILYPFEANAMLYRIQKYQMKKIKFAEKFGAIFLLRFIVFLVLNIGKKDNIVMDSIESSSERKKSKFETSSSVNNITSRQLRVHYERFQRILQLLIDDLNEDSHLLFI